MLRNGGAPQPRPSGDPLRIAVLCSQRAPGLRRLLELSDTANVSLVGVIASDPASTAIPDTAGTAVPVLVNDIRHFYHAAGAPVSDLARRVEYDLVTAQLLGRLEAELVVLCGYVHILTRPLLDVIPQSVISIHDSDLLKTGDDGLPRYRGLHSTRDAILAGESETRSTVHVVTPPVDVGPALVRSWPFPVHTLVEDARASQATDILRAYAYAHREWMMREAWGRMLSAAVRLFADDVVRVGDDRAYVRGVAGPVTLASQERRAQRRGAALGD
jgi:phosphoribosylglycinamide formyltransferase-1